VVLRSGTNDDADSQRVHIAVAALREVQRAEVNRLDERVRAIEEKVVTQRCELSLARYQIGELTKRLDRVEANRLPLQVASITLVTILSVIGGTAALLAILKALGVLH
jgi:chemotaxis response regulator CheB